MNNVAANFKQVEIAKNVAYWKTAFTKGLKS